MLAATTPRNILRQRQGASLYAVNFGGGQVTSRTASLCLRRLSVSDRRRQGSPAPVRDATLIGNGPEALKYVSMVGTI